MENISQLSDNIILMTDAYKHTHWLQMPPDTKKLYSYFESRGGVYSYTVFFGLQMILKKYLCGQVVTQEKIEEADKFCKEVFGTDKYFNRKGWQHILDKHDGYLPLIIKAVPEGTKVGVSNVLMTIENTDDEVPFLTNFVETLLVQTWYPTTVATIAYRIRSIINVYAEMTGCISTPFDLNDFGFRGVSSKESAGIGGCANLVIFSGTDTLEGIRYAKHYYNAPPCGFSVMASEHMTTTIWGKENEKEAYEHFINQCPNGILSVVSDSYDIYNAVEHIFGEQLKDKILARNGKFVVRPDSGDPVATSLKIAEILWDKFGGTVNKHGFKVLNPKIGIIYGDGINATTIDEILNQFYINNFASSNIIFGMGGALLQQLDRDTQKFAFKCSAALRDSMWIDVYKDPITDTGKKSKKGKLDLVYDGEQYYTIRLHDENNHCLQTVFENGKLVIDEWFNTIRERAKQ